MKIKAERNNLKIGKDRYNQGDEAEVGAKLARGLVDSGNWSNVKTKPAKPKKTKELKDAENTTNKTNSKD